MLLILQIFKIGANTVPRCIKLRKCFKFTKLIFTISVSKPFCFQGQVLEFFSFWLRLTEICMCSHLCIFKEALESFKSIITILLAMETEPS